MTADLSSLVKRHQQEEIEAGWQGPPWPREYSLRDGKLTWRPVTPAQAAWMFESADRDRRRDEAYAEVNALSAVAAVGWSAQITRTPGWRPALVELFRWWDEEGLPEAVEEGLGQWVNRLAGPGKPYGGDTWAYQLHVWSHTCVQGLGDCFEHARVEMRWVRRAAMALAVAAYQGALDVD